MQYTIKELADLAGVTTRTLRWYDQTGLLTPTGTTPAGYRLYDEAAVDRLQQILFYRELAFPLKDIKSILDAPDFDRRAALQSHLAELNRKKERLEVLILTVSKTLEHLEGGRTMSEEEKFEGFKAHAIRENEARYGREMRERYGNREVDQANANVMRLSREEYQRWTSIGEALLTLLPQAVRSGADPAGEAGRQIAQLHREWCSFSLGRYDPACHAGLAELYVTDERFTAYYDREEKGCARFLRDAIVSYTGSFA